MANRVLVVGGAGFIGSHLVEGLLQSGKEVWVFDNLATGSRHNLQAAASAVQFIEGDVRDHAALQQAMQGVETVFHLAAQTTVAGSLENPHLTHAVNNTGIQNLLWSALKQDVSQVVISSSCAVYGDSHQPPLKESYAVCPKSPYAASKVFAEALADSFYFSYGFPTVCLRYFNVYGERQAPDSAYAAVIPRFIDRYQQKSAPVIYGDGQQSRDFVHVSDVVKANLLAASLPETPLAHQRTFNIGSGVSVTLLELLERIAATAGFELTPDFQAAREGDVRQSMADTTLAATVLGFSTTVSLQTGIAQLFSQGLASKC